jgi:hypothetical protein
MRTEWRGRAIVVRGVFPPVPTRDMDYAAYLDDAEPPTGHPADAPELPFRQGWGRTAALAVADLVEQLEEDEELEEDAA